MISVFSPDRKYRYTLVREFVAGRGTIVFILLNPSTADELLNDPTVSRCIHRAKVLGYKHLIVVNLFAFRSTDPKALYKEKDPIGPENDSWILKCCGKADLIVAGWGAHGILDHRGLDVRNMLERFPLMCLGRTKGGEPKHPLYIPNAAELVPL